jgi:hypothetical protein
VTLSAQQWQKYQNDSGQSSNSPTDPSQKNVMSQVSHSVKSPGQETPRRRGSQA